MYKENAIFKTPADNTKIWRYMDFTKFVDIIDRRKMFFPTVAMLQKIDPFEGSFPKAYIDYFNANLDDIFTPETWKTFNKESAPKDFSRARKSMSKFVAVSCWNKQDEQSAALWKIYCSTFNGIAIESTIGRLKDSLQSEERGINIGEVEYIDHFSPEPSDLIPKTPVKTPDDILYKVFTYKGKSFNYENEVRAIVELPKLKKVSQFQAKFIKYHKGYNAKIDPKLLIEKVHLTPMTINKDSKWQKNVVKSVLVKYGLNKKVIIWDKKPVF